VTLKTKLSLSVAQEFTDTPGPRSRDQGDFSGDEFLERLLKPRFEDAMRESSILCVDLDGTEGYATSFLEAAFGGLTRIYGAEAVLQRLEFKSNDEPDLVEEIRQYITEAEKH
jgi:STAS-like domain of unknown function (DUF4325)